MTEREYLGSRKVCRSAEAVKTAQRTTIYFGTCERDNRPVCFEMPADLGKTAILPCFVCTLPVKAERLYAVQTHLDCEGACRSARKQFCSCGCGGVNHGRVWGQGALLDSREIVESAIESYRAEQAKITAKREVRREAEAQRKIRAFEEWAADQAEAIGWLMQADPTAEGSDFVSSMIWRLRRHEILSDRMLEVVVKIHGERTERDRQRAERETSRAAKPGAGDQGQLVPGVYKLQGEVYVVKPNREYIAWRKCVKAAHADGEGSQELQSAFAFLAGVPRPEGARLYAKRLVERSERVAKTGERVPAFYLDYAPGVIFEIALTDRLPLEEAREMSQRFRCCIYCGRTLDDPKSIAKGVGTDCVKYFGPVLDAAA